MWLRNNKGQSLIEILIGAAIGSIALIAVGAMVVSSASYHSQTRGKTGMIDEVSLLQKRLTSPTECMKLLPTDSLTKSSFTIPWDNLKVAAQVKGSVQFQRVTGASKSAELNLKISDATTSEARNFKIPISILVNSATQQIISCSTQSITSTSAADCVVQF